MADHQHDIHDPYPPISDYAVIGDCHTAALVSSTCSIDWCCMPRFDAASTFGRLLDWRHGGYCEIRPRTGHVRSSRRYVDGTLVLATTFDGDGGEAVVYDCFTTREGGGRDPYRQLLRVIEGVRGRMGFDVSVVPRFDYGDVRPWLRRRSPHQFTAVGGDDALVIDGDVDFEVVDRHDLCAAVEVQAGERRHLSVMFRLPEQLDDEMPDEVGAAELDRRLAETVAWWRSWGTKLHLEGPFGPGAIRSALVLKALTHAPTGAVVAAATTSLPESARGSRNWDYRYSWIRDSQFTVRALTALGATAEADGFRRFIERTAGGSAESLQIMYGVGGERRLPELELDLEGYDGASPVRIGNAASGQQQLDVYGYLMELSWRWHERGRSPDDDYWRFLLSVVDEVVERWDQTDCGIWEMRGNPQHFVHSKVMCWTAVERGLQLAQACLRRAPQRRWRRAADEIRSAVEERGVDQERGLFVQAFGSSELDASLLLIPAYGFVGWEDERMVRTVDAIIEELSEDGLIRRYVADDSLPGREGAFVAATFWLAECLARQGRLLQARATFERAVAASNDLGLFSEEIDARSGKLLGNFPQGLSHLSHISAAVALTDAGATTTSA